MNEIEELKSMRVRMLLVFIDFIIIYMAVSMRKELALTKTSWKNTGGLEADRL